ncbi:hypothetical protein MMC19_004446 [Ptychographa xylographoides]|nr:hypothetical protein [Ptychographa xylographoides]
MAPTFFRLACSSLILVSLLVISDARPSTHDAIHKRQSLVTPATLPGNWVFVGCQTEATNGRALSGASTAGNTVTDESCITFCSGKGYVYAGTEYSDECYCGNSLAAGSTVAAATDCNMACAGNATEQCGGPNRMTLFNNKGATAPSGPVTDPGPPGWTSLGCYAEGANGRTLTTGMATTGGTGALTVALCTSACHAANYIYAGVEYAGECYCGNAFSNGGGPAPDGLAGCNMVCNGNSSEYCGGPNRLDMYQFGGTGTGTGSSTSTTTAPPSGTTTAAGSATGLPTGWTYAGCYVDGANGRIMANQQPDSQTNTVESCVATCAAAGYTISGTEFSSQCFCGNNIQNGGVLASADSQCNTACSGNSAEMCGGGNRVSVYSKGPVQVLLPPAVQTGGLPGSWQYKGCLTDSGNPRTFPYGNYLTNNNTAPNCLSLCQSFGYNAAGMEYGDECWCGDVANIAVNGATLQPDANCNVLCSGNSSAYCGAGGLLSYYAWTGAPLYTWGEPTGALAGEYQQLVGGVCIPLLTTPGVNGKYTFLEKFGTGEPNSTGAYELDVSLITSNLAGAWRTMHVKTDVFCSASLTLPDKAGRQINIGGWSEQSTFGVRLYWPDGSAGVPGTNDWQENVNELSLQIGRWYPSAMVMTNGSILVVGGEVGSNSAAVPSLEILPTPAGGDTTVYCDWLQRTDPNNLYPFLAVLPSGGILVLYFNEARILNEVTFQTTRQLPNMPGAVNNFLGGRTYPLEGTSMLLPLVAPYTTPLTVLVCGGSTAGAGVAIDNCISIQPEVPGQNWTIERMPSQRVISCMTALPDGTFLILNGAHQGVAGFGLATSPNLNAVLYDPSKPVNARMSIMANTTVARLYHSEAILMGDGRVMVSGSDPQDGVHPEEYRVEVFVPPYLLAGHTQPTFTITNTDWTYAQTVAITVHLFQGTTATMRVSMMGAESSTHGNSMGARTLFPAFTCAGNTCSITAPPNAHVAPPGWYQLFVLDGPTPSHSTFVRIGKDPGGIGAWPAFPDFTIPGPG